MTSQKYSFIFAIVFLALCLFCLPCAAAEGERNSEAAVYPSVEPWETDDPGRAASAVYAYYIPYFLADSDYWTGVGLRNGSGTASASVTVYGMSDGGSVLGSQTKTIPAEGQTAFMMNPGEGWVKVNSDQPLTGLGFVAMVHDDKLMFDIPFVSLPATTLYIPHVAQDATWDTTVFVCNPNGSTTTMYLTFFNAAGTVVKVQGYTLPANGSGKYPLSVFLGASASYDKGSVRITATQGVAAFALYNDLKSGGHCYAGINAVTHEVVPEAAPVVPTPFTNSIGMTFVPIPAGIFMMGSPSSEPRRSKTETQHQVSLTKSYYLQATEVTQGQWKAVMGSNPSYFSSCGDNCPVEMISWDDCQSFISKLNQKEGTTKYRLPTEAEWEYACRAGTTTPFNTGSCLSTNEANYDGNYPLVGCPKGIYRKKTVPVGSFSPNAWGLYDMHGNVLEWCQDWYGFYPSSPVTNPEGPLDSLYGLYKILRGGTWGDYGENCRSAKRLTCNPDGRTSITGARIVRDF